MSNVSKESLVGNILPTIYIKRIALETSGDEVKDSNPHINHEREEGFTKNPITGKVEPEKKSIDYDKKSFSEYEESEQLQIKLDFVVKEKFDNSLLGSWFGNQDFMKYLKVGIIQSKNKDLTLEIIKNSIPFLEYQKTLQDKNQIRNLSLSELITDFSPDRRFLNIEGTVQNKFTSIIDNDGNQIYDITFSTSFILRGTNPQHLAYFAVSYLDVETMIKDYNMDVDTTFFKSLHGPLTSQLVIDEGKTLS